MEDQNGSDRGGREDDGDIRSQAIKRLKRRRDFRRNLVAYLVVNAILWAIWALSGAEVDDPVPWPTWISGIWGVLLLLDGWKAYGERPISEREIEEEMDRIGRRG
jgi:hypothetical protein